ncbi:MAG: hypothetical protein LUI39_05315 [Lachnospiraceae bacterium]|nr:hypothetical protein [Lachnospiraceae bacterium]
MDKDEELELRLQRFDGKMLELQEMVSGMRKKYPVPPEGNYPETELKTLRVYTVDSGSTKEGLRVTLSYNVKNPTELCVNAFVDNGKSNYSMDIFCGQLEEVETYLGDKSGYPEIRGYLSILRERIMQGDW